MIRRLNVRYVEVVEDLLNASCVPHTNERLRLVIHVLNYRLNGKTEHHLQYTVHNAMTSQTTV